MIGRLTRLRGQLSSHWLASAVAVGYVVLSVALGIALLATPEVDGGGAAPAASTPTYIYEDDPTSDLPFLPEPADDSGPLATSSAPPSTTSTTTTPPPTSTAATPPAGFMWVNGPGGLHTVIPSGWRTMRSTGPGAMQAVDPAEPVRYVKYGGAAAPPLAIDASHVQYENGFALRAMEYKRIKLSSAAYGGHDAVEWEFEYREAGNLLHIRSLYWRADGKEFFVLAAAPASRWETMIPVYDAMIANATP
jgi:hypothetical protein